MDKTQKLFAKMQRTGVMADQHKEEENRKTETQRQAGSQMNRFCF
jgi:hypothetical protein